jgi:uroporphyrinogen-III synthase
VRLLVTRPHPDSERTAGALRARGHRVLIAPVLRMEARDCALADQPYAAVVMTSANAARAIGGHPRCADLAKLAAFTVGRHTAQAARAVGFRDVHCADGDRNDLADMLRERLDASSAPLLYLTGEDRAGDFELAPSVASIITAVIYRMVKVERFAASVESALTARQIDGVLHFSRRSAQAYVECAGRVGLLGRALEPLHFCLSRQVAEPLAAQALAARDPGSQDLGAQDLGAHDAAGIRIAPHPHEAALIALVNSSM